MGTNTKQLRVDGRRLQALVRFEKSVKTFPVCTNSVIRFSIHTRNPRHTDFLVRGASKLNFFSDLLVFGVAEFCFPVEVIDHQTESSGRTIKFYDKLKPRLLRV